MWYGDKMWMFAYQRLSDRGFGLVLLILLGLLSGIEISCCMDPKLVAWSWKDIQGTILHHFKSWSCILLNHSERSHGLLPFGRRPSPGSKKVLCMQKQMGLSWVQLSKSFEFYTVWNAIPWKPWSLVEAQNLLKYLWTNSVTGLSIPWPNTA